MGLGLVTRYVILGSRFRSRCFFCVSFQIDLIALLLWCWHHYSTRFHNRFKLCWHQWRSLLPSPNMCEHGYSSSHKVSRMCWFLWLQHLYVMKKIETVWETALLHVSSARKKQTLFNRNFTVNYLSNLILILANQNYVEGCLVMQQIIFWIVDEIQNLWD